MPLFLDIHSLDDPVTLNEVTQAHAAGVRTQELHGVSYLRYWVDEAAGKICLVNAPSADVAAAEHREAHGLVAQEIYQVIEGGH